MITIISPSERLSTYKDKLHYSLGFQKGVSLNGQVSPGQVLAESEHLECTQRDAWDNLGVAGIGKWA